MSRIAMTTAMLACALSVHAYDKGDYVQSAQLKDPSSKFVRLTTPKVAPRFLSDRDKRRIYPYDGPPSFKSPQVPAFLSDCVIDFDNKDALSLLPDGAKDTFVLAPFWIQECSGDNWAAVQPVDYWHYHLGYEDPNINLCLDLGDFGRDLGDGTCEPIDPVQETRSHIRAHDYSKTIRVFVYDSDSQYVSFDLEQIRVVDGPVRLCYKKAGEWEAAVPGGNPGWFCLEELEAGWYDVSAFADDVVDVEISAAAAQNFSIDDIRLGVNP